MDQLLPTLVVLLVAAITGLLLRRRRPEAPTQSRRWPVPAQVDRNDFAQPGLAWLVLVFTSTTCDGCARMTAKAEVLASDDVAYEAVPFQERKDLHERYGIEAAPTTLIVDAEGVVERSFVGEVTATDLWAALAEVRAGI